jgi:predicted TIM-barrel fold metal-dependent hydrolase
MVQVTIPDELEARIQALKHLVDAVLDEQLSFDEYVAFLLWQAGDVLLAQLLALVGEETLLQTILKLAARNPALVYEFATEALRSGQAAQEARDRLREQLKTGFRPPPAMP